METINNTILIIEDDAAILELVNECILECGYTTKCFQSAKPAIEWLENNIPFLMVIDYTLPEMYASEFIKHVQHLDSTPSPFIVTTGQGDERIAVQMMKLGAKEYLIKDSQFLEMLPIVISKVASEIEKEIKIRIIEKELEELNVFNKQIINSANEGIIVYDSNFKYKAWNPFMEKLTGLPASDIIGKTTIEVFPQLHDECIKDCIKNAYYNNQICEKEFYFNLPSTGKSGWVIETIAPLYNSKNEAIAIINTVHDITERKQSEIKLKENENKLSVLFKNSPDSYILIVDGVFVECNHATEVLLGGTRDQIIGQTPANISPEYQNDGLLSSEKAASIIAEILLTGKKTFEWTHLRFDNTMLEVEVSIVKMELQNQITLFTTWRDITARKKAEKALAQTKQSYENIINTVSEAIYVIDETGSYIDVNEGATKMYKYSKEEFIGKSAAEFAAPGLNDLMLITSKLFNVFTTGISESFEFWAVRKNGEIFPKEVIANKGLYFEKEVLIVTAREISERLKAEKALRESELKYRRITDNIADVVWLTDLEFNMSYVSPSIEKMVGDTPERHMKRRTEEKFTPDSLIKLRNLYFTELNHGIKNTFKTIEVEHLKADGSIFWAEMKLTFLTDENNNLNGILGVTRDISERKKSETQIIRLNDCFLSLGSDTIGNINKLVETCGELLNGTFATYNKLHEGLIHTIGKWNVPLDAKLIHKPEERICYEVIKNTSEHAYIVENLQNTTYVKTDPFIKLHELKTYIGKSIKLNNKNIGALCVVYQTEVTPSENELRLMEIFASAIGIEEEKMFVQSALAQSEEKYRTVIENSNDIIWMLDSEGCFTFANESASRVTGLIIDDWIGKSFAPLVFEEDLQEMMDVFDATMKGASRSYELRFKKTDNTILIFSVNTTPLYLKNVIVGMVSFTQDITERKKTETQLKESEELYRNLVNRIPDGVYKSTSAGKFIDVNPAMVKMLGYNSKEEMLQIDIKKDLYFDESHRDPKYLNPNNEEEAIFQLKKKDGTGIWIEDHGWYNFDEDGNKITHEGVLRDITERKAAEDTLHEKMEELIRFHRLTVGRELTMIELKKEINKLCLELGRDEKFRIVE